MLLATTNMTAAAIVKLLPRFERSNAAKDAARCELQELAARQQAKDANPAGRNDPHGWGKIHANLRKMRNA